jgi:hypothetical protein
MQRSENIGQLIGALAVAQAKFKAVTKDRNASIQSKTGGSFRYSYADLATGIGAVKDALSANGLAVVQPARLGEGVITVTTLLAHSSGEWISEEMSWPVAATDNRSIGSGITYARRHSLLAMVGAAATDEDDDAESARGGAHDTASAPPPRQQQQARPPAPREPSGKPPVTLDDRKKAIAADLKGLGYEPAGIPLFVKGHLGHDKATTEEEVTKLEAAVALLKAQKASDKDNDLQY